MISPSNWEQIRALFQSALDRAPEERAAFLRAQSNDDEILREVASLLAAHADADALLVAGGRGADAPPMRAGAARGGSAGATLPSGAHLGPYVVVGPLGAGAMGEVYRARDTNLRREVALKVLPEALAANRDRLARFTREARTLGAFNHPHIAQVYGFEEYSGVRALVMELVEGRDLAQRVARGPLRVEEALRIARQIAEALEAAHTRGIVHRDLKPANIMIRDDGMVKVLDFGLAKAWLDDSDSATPPGAAPAAAPTLTTLPTATDVGVLVGTAAYMSPEQARGGAVDKGSDIWAFGCVLYEMLTGTRAFEGAGAADTFANVLQRDPRWDRLPDATPPPIQVLLRRCLRKDRRERLQDAAGVRIEIDDVLQNLNGGARIIDTPGQARVDQSPRGRATSRQRWWAAAALVACGLAAVAYAVVGRHSPPSREPSRDGPLQATRLTAYAGTEWAPSLSPDGSQVAFSWNGPTQDNHDIYIKLVGPGEPIRLTTNRTRDDSPAWSPDGTEIAFLRWHPRSDTMVDVMVVPALGHAAERRIGTVTLRPLGLTSRISWTPDGHWIAIGLDVPADSRGIWLLSRDGRERRRLTTASDGEFASDFSPVFSSDGRHLAFIRPAGIGASVIHLLALSPALEPIGRPVPVVTRLTLQVHDLAWAGDDSALVFSSGPSQGQSRLQRIPLRPDRLAPSGPEAVLPFGAQATTLSLNRSGRLVYVEQYRDSNLERVNLAARASDPVAEVVAESTYDETVPAYSRDGRRIAFKSTRTGSPELWISNADGTNLRQWTFMGASLLGGPQWSPVDDDRVLFNARLEGRSALYVLDLGAGTTDRLTNDGREYVEARWSRDGRWIYAASPSMGRMDVWRLPSHGGAAIQWTRNGGTAASEGADGFLYYARAARPPTSIWRMPATGGPETLVVEGLSYAINFAVGARGLFFVSRGESMYDTAVEYVDFGSLTRTRLAGLGGRRWGYGVALSPDARWFMYSVVQNENSNLMVVDDVR
jgi:serine/threonine protein kinase/Tol biopolymer transport system component